MITVIIIYYVDYYYSNTVTYLSFSAIDQASIQISVALF
jgi:hypothetical protein